MTRFFIVRHGQTEGNKNKIYRGRWDLPLNPTGLKQVELAGRALAPVDLDAIYTSPLERTRQTAAALVKHQQVEARDEQGLIDIDYGGWTRVADSEVARSQPEIYRRWKSEPQSVVFPDGEGLADVRGRVEPMLKRLVAEYPDGQLALCGHRVSVKMILMVALGLPDAAFWRIAVDPASISVIDFAVGAFSMVFTNETCHLEPLLEKLKAADF